MICERPYTPKTGSSLYEWFHSQDSKMAAIGLPCGRCLPCRINKSRVWSTRILLEQLCHEKSCFVTLTYNDENYPEGGNLEPFTTQLWFKALRNRFPTVKIRYFLVGEYGELSQRPHYHCCLFGLDEFDSTGIEETWSIGFVHIGELNPKSAQYITGYAVKGWTENSIEKLNGRVPEFSRSSRRPGIAGPAIDQIARKLKGKGELPYEIRLNGKKMPIGRYGRDRLKVILNLEDKAYEQLSRYQTRWLDAHFDLFRRGYHIGDSVSLNEGAINSIKKKAEIKKSKSKRSL